MSLLDHNIAPFDGSVEIDRVVESMRSELSALPWIEEAYHRGFRHLDVNTGRRHPFVYLGGDDSGYASAKPDNCKTGTLFFMVGDRQDGGDDGIAKYKIGVIFSANLKLIDEARLKTELFTQELIRDARNVMSIQFRGKGFVWKNHSETRRFEEIYKEFLPFADKDETHLDESQNYGMPPMQQFRINLEVTVWEDCSNVTVIPPVVCDPVSIQKPSGNEIATREPGEIYIVPDLDIRVMDLLGDEVVLVPASEVVYDQANNRYQIEVDMAVANLTDIGDVPNRPNTTEPWFLQSPVGGGDYSWVKVDDIAKTITVTETQLTGFAGSTEDRIAQYLSTLSLGKDWTDGSWHILYDDEL